LKYCLHVRELSGLCGTLWGLYKVGLLYGPPGTGKTSLALGCANEAARAEVQKSGKNTKLLRLNVSAWFSEFLGQTVKAVEEAFVGIRMAADHAPVTVVIDEVESVGLERSSLGAGDPSDVLRGVNALLNELDRMRFCKGVLVLATSNLPSSIDRALWDKTDVKFFLGNPTKQAAREILTRSAAAMQEKLGVPVSARAVEALLNALYDGSEETPFSGRALSRLLPLAFCLKGPERIKVRDVVDVAKRLMTENGKEEGQWKR
jgi:SpoVK/Ycf46/Vps4 family AAA+-type ATPase